MLKIKNNVPKNFKNPLIDVIYDEEMFSLLRQADIDVGQFDDYDFAIATDDVEGPIKPRTIIFERIDGCQVKFNNRCLPKMPNMVLLVKMYKYHEWEIANLPSIEGRLFTRKLELDTKKYQEVNPLNEEDYKKTCNGFSFVHYHRLDPGVELVKQTGIEGERPIDVFFAGSTNYGRENGSLGKLVSDHRKSCGEVIENIPDINSLVVYDRAYTNKKYLGLMMQSKVTVCPWGWGEACYRDYEAIMCGCRVIKPKSIDRIESIPDIYREPHMTFCRPDWQNLPEMIIEQLNKWKQVDQKRREQSEVLISYRTPQAKAKIFKNIIEKAMKG